MGQGLYRKSFFPCPSAFLPIFRCVCREVLVEAIHELPLLWLIKMVAGFPPWCTSM